MINGASPGSRKDFQTKETAVSRQKKEIQALNKQLNKVLTLYHTKIFL